MGESTGRLAQYGRPLRYYFLGLGGGLAVLAIAGGLLNLRNDAPIGLPEPRGPRGVGRVLADWPDARRGRDLRVFVWYPAVGERGSAAEYVPGKWGDRMAARMFPIPPKRAKAIGVAAGEGRAVEDGLHPMVILSPGMGRIPADYTVIAEELASFGYVVIGVTPTGSSSLVVFPDGREVRGEPNAVDLEHRDRAEGLVQTWVDDFRFATDRIQKDERFAGRVDRARVGLLGHSFGGAAAMRALADDARFKAAVNLDGAPEGKAVSLKKPALFLMGAPLPDDKKALNDRILGEIRAECEGNGAGCTMEVYPEARHMNFSDMGAMPSRWPIPKSKLELGEVDGVAFLRKVNLRVRAFFGNAL